jgi:hypothetical protein
MPTRIGLITIAEANGCMAQTLEDRAADELRFPELGRDGKGVLARAILSGLQAVKFQRS